MVQSGGGAGGGQGQFVVQGVFNTGPIVAGANQVQQRFNALGNQVNAVGRQVQQSGNLLTGFFRRPAKELIFLGLDIQQLSASLALLSLPIGLAGVAATKFAFDFQTNLADLNSLLKLSQSDLQVFGEQLRNISRDPTIVQTPVELAKSFKEVASSGFSGARGIEVIRAAAVGATAGQAELTATVKALTGVLNALPRGTIRAQEVIDLMAATVDKGTITFQELADELGDVIGTVGAAGISFQETSAAIATLTVGGIPASEAMTSLNNLILSFIAPTKEAREAAEGYGIELSLSALRSKGLVGALEEVNQKLGGNATALKRIFPENRAFRGAVNLIRNDTQDFARTAGTMSEATLGIGEAARQAAEQLRSPREQLRLLQKDVQNISLEFGRDLVAALLFATNAFRSLAGGLEELGLTSGPIRIAVEALGGFIIVSNALLFIAGRFIIGAGAIVNLFRNLALASGTATAALNVNTVATTANVAAQQRMVTLTIANATVTSRYAVALGGAAAASGAAAAGVTAVGTASTAAASGVALLLSRLSLLASALAAVAGAAFAGNILGGFIVDVQTANKSSEDLIRRLGEVQNAFGGLFTKIPRNFLTRQIAGVGALEDLEQRVFPQPDLTTQLAIQQAQEAQREFSTAASQNVEVVRAQLQKGIEISQDPALRARFQEGLSRLLEGGAEAISQSGFSVLSSGQKALVREFVSGLEEARDTAVSVGATGVAEEAQRRIDEVVSGFGGFEIRVPLVVEDITGDELRRLSQLREAATRAAAEDTRVYEQSLADLKRAQDATRIAQLLLNLEMNAAQRALNAAQAAVDDLESALDDANRRLEEFTHPTLVGMTALDNAIFQASQHVAQLNLELLNIQSVFIPGMFEAEEEVLRLRLALLQAGEEAENLGRKAQFGIDDLIAAQQRELREGVPVLRTIFEKIEAAARGEDREETKSPERRALEDAEKRLEIKRIEEQLATIAVRRELELAGIEQQRLELTRQITFDPLLRELEQLASMEEEITFEEAVAGIEQAKQEIANTNLLLEDANIVLADRQSIVDDLQRRQEELQEITIRQQIQEILINAAIEDRNRQLQNQLAIYQQEEDVLRSIAGVISQMADEADAARAIADAKAAAALTESQATTNSIREQALGILTQAEAFFGSIVGNIKNIFAGSGFVGTAVGAATQAAAGIRGLLGFHEGGPVAPNLTPGTEIPARLLAGEYVLSRDQVARIGMSALSSGLSSTSNNWNWNVTINNQRGGDVYSKLFREAHIRRLGGWGRR